MTQMKPPPENPGRFIMYFSIGRIQLDAEAIVGEIDNAETMLKSDAYRKIIRST